MTSSRTNEEEWERGEGRGGRRSHARRAVPALPISSWSSEGSQASSVCPLASLECSSLHFGGGLSH